MEIRLLGPVRLRSGTHLIDVGPVQRRAVLAALAVDAGRPVTMATLTDRAWDTVPPTAAREALYSYISRLRRLLGASHRGDRPDGARRDGQAGERPIIRLVGREVGYLLDVDPQLVDLHRFRQLLATARDIGSDDTKRAKLLGEALQLWSGPPMADLPGRWAAQMRTG